MDGIPRLRAIDVTDPPGLWSDLGFAVDATGRCLVSGVALRLGAPPLGATPSGATLSGATPSGATPSGGTAGLGGWAVDGAPDLHELPVAAAEPESDAVRAGDPADEPNHRNGVTALDHVVVTTPDLDRTVAAFEASGVPLRRIRQAGAGVTQAFFRIGPVIIEVVSREDSAGTGPAALWGLAFTVADLDATAAALGERLRPARPAVQPGRLIAALDRAAGSAVPMVFMSPHPGHQPATRLT